MSRHAQTTILATLTAVSVLLTAGLVWSRDRVERPSPATATVAAQPLADLSAAWGIQILSLRQTSAGHMLDLRYRVTDPALAAPLLGRSTTASITDDLTGIRQGVYRAVMVGPLRSSQPTIAGRTYFMMFSNPGKTIPVGARVGLELGELRVDDILVE